MCVCVVREMRMTRRETETTRQRYCRGESKEGESSSAPFCAVRERERERERERGVKARYVKPCCPGGSERSLSHGPPVIELTQIRFEYIRNTHTHT